MSDNSDDDLQSSELGTLEFWEDTYALEIGNFQDHGDVGEVWFGEDSSLRVTRWLSSCDEVLKDDAIIDLGCGNGMHLIELMAPLLLFVTMYTYPTLEKTTLRFLISGHSYLPNEAEFGDIECALKLQQRMYSPEDYINVMLECCKRNKLVTMMGSSDFVGTTAL
uniref:Uncharacterized protein n=1 Tax=Timema cristinae TaxID=61476 RepID=A0A7R9C8L7_TIMCR|nr:unnamed protein product [Timema cristinae]